MVFFAEIVGVLVATLLIFVFSDTKKAVAKKAPAATTAAAKKKPAAK